MRHSISITGKSAYVDCTRNELDLSLLLARNSVARYIPLEGCWVRYRDFGESFRNEDDYKMLKIARKWYIASFFFFLYHYSTQKVSRMNKPLFFSISVGLVEYTIRSLRGRTVSSSIFGNIKIAKISSILNLKYPYADIKAVLQWWKEELKTNKIHSTQWK